MQHDLSCLWTFAIVASAVTFAWLLGVEPTFAIVATVAFTGAATEYAMSRQMTRKSN